MKRRLLILFLLVAPSLLAGGGVWDDRIEIKETQVTNVTFWYEGQPLIRFGADGEIIEVSARLIQFVRDEHPCGARSPWYFTPNLTIPTLGHESLTPSLELIHLGYESTVIEP